MNESSTKRTVIVGIFIFVGLMILLAAILAIGNIRDTFSKKMRISAHFEDVNGLLPGSNVWFSGVKIGMVKRLQFYGKSQVEVILNVDKTAQRYIRKNAKVKISSDGLIGNKIIVITGGTSIADQVEDGDTLGTLSSLSTEDMMATFQESNKNLVSITNDFKLISNKLAKGEGSISKFLNNDQVYNNVSATSSSLAEAAKKTKGVMSNLQNISTKMNTKGNLINDLATDTVIYTAMKSSMQQLRKTTDSVNMLIANLKRASANTASPMGVMLHDEATGAHLKETIKNLETSSQKLDKDLEALQHNFLLRGYFRKEEKRKLKEQENQKK